MAGVGSGGAGRAVGAYGADLLVFGRVGAEVAWGAGRGVGIAVGEAVGSGRASDAC